MNKDAHPGITKLGTGCLYILGALVLVGLVKYCTEAIGTTETATVSTNVTAAQLMASEDDISVFSGEYKMYVARNEYLLNQIAAKSKNYITHENIMNIVLKTKELYYVEKGKKYSAQLILEQLSKAMPEGKLVEPHEVAGLLLSLE